MPTFKLRDFVVGAWSNAALNNSSYVLCHNLIALNAIRLSQDDRPFTTTVCSQGSTFDHIGEITNFHSIVHDNLNLVHLACIKYDTMKDIL